MKKIISIAVTGIALAITTSTAFAWTYSLSGKGACQSDGSYQITWTVDNSVENEAFHIKSSSNTSAVPLGDVPAHQAKNYKQTVDGSKTGSYSLSLTGNFNSDQTLRTRSATVNLDKPCDQPGGKGGGTTTTTTPTTPAVTETAAAPAVVPVGAVNAGDGGASSNLNLAAAIAMVASIAAIAIGVVRRVKA